MPVTTSPDISSTASTYTNSTNLINSRVATANALVESAFAEYQSLVEELSAAFTSDVEDGSAVDYFTDFDNAGEDFNSEHAAAVGGNAIPAFPVKDDTISSYADEANALNAPVSPVFPTTLDSQDLSVSIPTFSHDAPSATISFQEVDYTSALLTSIKSSLESDLSGGTGLSAEVEQALYDRHTGRKDAEVERLMNNTINSFSAKGWYIPHGAMAGQLMEVGEEQARLNTDVSNDLMARAAELEQSNRQATISAIVQIEDICARYYSEKQNRSLDAKKSSVSAALDLWNGLVNQYNSAVAAARVAFELEVERMKASLDLWEKKLRTYEVDNDIYKTRLGQLIEEQKLYLQVYTDEAKAFESAVRARGISLDSITKKYEVRGGMAEKKAMVALKEAENTLVKALRMLEMQVTAIQGQAQQQAQIMASSLNSVNASASFGWSGSLGQSISYDGGEV